MAMTAGWVGARSRTPEARREATSLSAAAFQSWIDAVEGDDGLGALGIHVAGVVGGTAGEGEEGSGSGGGGEEVAHGRRCG
jgi:hypothetical protein